MNSFRIILTWLLLAVFADTSTADFGFFLRSLLLKSADLSSYKAPQPITKRPTTTTTTAAPTTTAAASSTAPPPLPPPFLQRGFYKTIPGLGRIGFDFGFGGIVGRPFPRPPPGNGYLDFDYYDYFSTSSTTPAATTTAAATTTTAAPASTTAAPNPPVFTRRPQRPVRPQNGLPPPQNGIPYPYSDPYYGPRGPLGPPPQSQAYNFYNQQRKYNGIYGGQIGNYDYTAYNNGQAQFSPRRLQAQQRYVYRNGNSIASPVIGSPISRAQLNDNLVYQYAPTDDIYTNNPGGDDAANSDSDAGSSNGESNDVPPDNNGDDSNSISPDYNGDNYFDNAANAVPSAPANDYANDAVAVGDDGGDNTATNAPDSEPTDTKVDYIDNSATSDISSPTNSQLNNPNYAYTNNNNAAAASYTPSNPPTAPQKLFIQPESFPDDGHTSFASVRFRSPHVHYHTIAMNRGHPRKYYK